MHALAMANANDDDALELGGSEAAVRALVEGHARFLAFLERRVESRAVAEEILQEAFVRGLAKGGALRDEESATAWFYRLLRNALVDHYRRRDVERRALSAVAREADEEAYDPELLRTVCTCVTSLLDALKPEYAEAIRRVDLEGARVADYAKAIGIEPNNASVRLHRARLALRKALERCCGSCVEHGCVDCHCEKPAHAHGGAGHG